jgi:hypothetical protein
MRCPAGFIATALEDQGRILKTVIFRQRTTTFNFRDLPRIATPDPFVNQTKVSVDHCICFTNIYLSLDLLVFPSYYRQTPGKIRR